MDFHKEKIASISYSIKNHRNSMASLEFCINDKVTNSPTTQLVESFRHHGRTIKSFKNFKTYKSFRNSRMSNILQVESIDEDSIKMEDTPSVLKSSLNLNVLLLKESDDSIVQRKEQLECSWMLGQLVWARIGGFPYWPSIVSEDPLTKSYVSQKGSIKNLLTIHVTYCADKGRHSWVTCRNIMNYEGLAHFEKLSKKAVTDKKKPQYNPGFIIKPTLKLQWDKAVAEANELMAKSLEQRIEFLNLIKKKKKNLDRFKDLKKNVLENGKKRKKNSSFDESLNKKSRSNVEFQEKNLKNETELEIKEIKSTTVNINLQTPPTPPLSHKDSSDEATTLKSQKSLTASKIFNIYEVFCERNKEVAVQMDPNASIEDIEEYLGEMWSTLSAQERSKYRADYVESLKDEEYVESDFLDEKLIRKEKIKDFESEENSDKDENKKLNLSSKSKIFTNKKKGSGSDQDDTTSVESDNFEKSLQETSRKHRSKLTSYYTLQNFSNHDNRISFDHKYRKKKLKIKIEESLEKEEISVSIDFLKKPRQYKLFKGLKIERVCQICEEPGKIIRCKGPCFSYYHLQCAKPEETPELSEAKEEKNASQEDLDLVKDNRKNEGINEDEDYYFRCIDCLSGVAPPCFVCQERGIERTKCSVIACGKHYHLKCLKKWPQAHYQGERLICPYHVCHMCISDNPQNGNHPRSSNEKFVRCVRCPSTYHASATCLPAGSQLITASQIICPKHYKSATPPVNVTWCFICAKGGSLICCDTCPTSFHEECLGINAPDDDYICEDCETGRLPLYGEVVWVKLGTYRWWPSLICYPQDIPANIANKPHKTGEFCVMFLGSRDYYWVHRGRVFLYHDGDDRTKVIGNKKVEESYKKAVEEAKILYDRLTTEKAAYGKNNGSQPLKPPPYKKLKVNKPVGNVKIPEPDSIVACECDPNQSNPCSPISDCLNRILSIECSPDVCRAGSKCQNQLFAQRKYPNMKPFHTEGRGWGLKTLQHIYDGQFIIEYVGEVIDEAEYKLRLKQKRERKNDDYYFLTIDNYRMIDAEPKGNLSRFMNHSCQPNCETQKWTVNGDTRIGLFALRDIIAGEELTFNYNLACDGETRKPCLCNAPNCSGFIGLKVSKQQISIAQQKKIEKAEKFKKQRKQKKMNCWSCSLKIDNSEDSCRCEQKTCGKNYHKYCVEEITDPIFHCPWHFCAECHKRTSLRCNYCCNAFCINHTHGNLRENFQLGIYVCHNHASEYSKIGNVEFNVKNEFSMDHGGFNFDQTMQKSWNREEDIINDDETAQKNHLLKFDETVKKEVSKMVDEISTVMTPPQLDESSSRGTIVEVSPRFTRAKSSKDYNNK